MTEIPRLDQRAITPALNAADSEAVSVPERFEQIVERYADKVAVKRGAETMTYAQINALANRLARTILALPGAMSQGVALVFDRRPAVIAAMFGVLKAGKFYVPIDISDPRPRLALMIADAQSELIVTDSDCLQLARELGGETCTIINMDELDPAVPDTNPGFAVDPAAPVYLLYTSGTTGTPKGIGQSHPTIVRFASARGIDPRVAVTPEDRLTMLNSLSVMASAARIFGALLVGASLAVYDLKVEGLAGTAEWLRRDEVTIYQSTSTLFRHFCATLKGPADLPHLRIVKLMGEPVLKHDVELFKRLFPSPRLLQVSFGTTESKTFAEYVIDHATEITGGVVPAGYAKYDAEIAIWDETGHDVGFDQIGEIVVKSVHVPAGYWRRPELSAAVFLPDPSGGKTRTHRTGDLGRLRPDGLLEHFGRKDQQVKIRGNRIEVGEIESALLQIDGIAEAVVIARDDPHGEKQLVAYVVAAGTPAQGRDLRRRLRQTLPGYMLPAAIVRLDRLPLNAGGKTDRNALPAP